MQDKVVQSSQLFETKEYGKFKTIGGNRHVDQQHVRRLAQKMKKEGNLLQYFPIIVNENMEVIDGQHRLRAAEINKFPVFYEVKHGLNVSSVRQLNTGHKNWTWYDYAISYAKLGNRHYQHFLDLFDEFHERYSILSYFCTGGTNSGRGGNRPFVNGELVIKNVENTRKLLKQYQELCEVANISNREFALAAYRFMRTPTYNHETMVDKIMQYGDPLKSCWTTSDFLFELENIARTN